MTTKNTAPTFKSASSGPRTLPVYKHSDAAEFIRVDDFNLFEYMLWHQGVARDTGNAKAEALRQKGILTLVATLTRMPPLIAAPTSSCCRAPSTRFWRSRSRRRTHGRIVGKRRDV